MKAHNRNALEIYCYSDVRKPDQVTSQIEALSDRWLSVTDKPNEDVIAQIRSDRIDILVDLAGHTGGNRLLMFAGKPAPIQVSWLGYPNTTGLAEIDYRLTDAVADPVGKDDGFYSEELIRLQDCFLCFHPYEQAPGVAPPPFEENGSVTFGSFNNLSKVTPEVISAWSEILRSIPGSRLVLKYKSLADETVRKEYLELFGNEGIAADRIEMLDIVPDIIEHLELYEKFDIALDTFPYNGTTTTCEALWQGVPVVALSGDRHSGRVGASILQTVGLKDLLVADSVESYIARAVALAGNKEQLRKLRKNLRLQMQGSPLCDATSFARKIEKAYQEMWARYTGNNGREE